MTDQEREDHIAFCAKQMEICMAVGDRKKAQSWLEDMTHAIASRSPETVARMERERGLDRCETFDHLAERDLPFFLRRQVC